jgi:hypothetical protein
LKGKEAAAVTAWLPLPSSSLALAKATSRVHAEVALLINFCGTSGTSCGEIGECFSFS